MEDPSASVGIEFCSGFLLDKTLFFDVFFCEARLLFPLKEEGVTFSTLLT